MCIRDSSTPSPARCQIDVYKRQVHYFEAAASGIQPPAFYRQAHHDAGAEAVRRRGTVSYTHLDVYKRQALKAVGATGITTSSGTFSGLGVCSAVFAELPSGVLDASLRLKERGCAGTPVCVQVPVISAPVSLIFPSYLSLIHI